MGRSLLLPPAGKLRGVENRGVCVVKDGFLHSGTGWQEAAAMLVTSRARYVGEKEGFLKKGKMKKKKIE